MFEYYHAPAPQLDDVLDELREAREMVAYLTRANEALTAQLESTLKDRAAIIAERDALREDLEELDFLRHEGGPDSVAAMEADRDRLQKALTDAGAYIDKGQDKMAFNIIRAALRVSA